MCLEAPPTQATPESGPSVDTGHDMIRKVEIVWQACLGRKKGLFLNLRAGGDVAKNQQTHLEHLATGLLPPSTLRDPKCVPAQNFVTSILTVLFTVLGTH